MKKFRIVAMLLVLVLATSCFAAGTFAKYTSTTNGSDSAVVAKWSINIDGDATSDTAGDITSATFVFDLFKDSYVFETSTNTEDIDVDNGSSKTIIAPGTWGYADIVLTNMSEVTAEYGIGLQYSPINNDTYNIPLQFALVKDPANNDMPATGWNDTISDLNKNADLISTNTEYQIQSVANSGTVTWRLYWKWDFSGSTAIDANDTALGILAQEANRPTATVELTLNAEQVD